MAGVAAWPLGGRHAVRRRARILVRLSILVLPACLFFGFMLLAVPGWARWMWLGVVLLATPFGWLLWMSGREALATKALRRQQTALMKDAPGPVYFAAGLIGGAKGAAAQLIRLLLDEADANNVTVLARTEDGPLLTRYRRMGFSVAAQATTWWGRAVLVVRNPSPQGRTLAVSGNGLTNPPGVRPEDRTAGPDPHGRGQATTPA